MTPGVDESPIPIPVRIPSEANRISIEGANALRTSPAAHTNDPAKVTFLQVYCLQSADANGATTSAHEVMLAGIQEARLTEALGKT